MGHSYLLNQRIDIEIWNSDSNYEGNLIYSESDCSEQAQWYNGNEHPLIWKIYRLVLVISNANEVD